MVNKIREALQCQDLAGKDGLDRHRLTDRMKWIVMLVQRLYVNAGQIADQDQSKVITSQLDNYLSTTYKKFTCAEVELALEFGVYREYGDYFGINSVTVIGWLKSYLNSPERARAKHLSHKETPQLEDHVRPSDAEIENILHNSALDKFTKFKEGRPWFDFGNPTYDYLHGKGIIKMTLEVRNKIYEEAKRQVVLEKGYRPSMVSERVRLEQELGLEITAKNRAKQLALESFFGELVTHERELSEFI